MKTSVLRNYRVLKKLGQGGMGMVYLAEDVALERQVALKFLAPYLVQDPEIMGRFRAEARNQARLVHPHITMVYAFQEFEDQAFLVLEYLDGETLENRIQRQGKIPVAESAAIMRDLLSAMEYAHKKGVVHRDIKPGNIGFTADGRVKLMDFGIALNVDETQRLTRTGHTLGTPHYMAPEQILGQPADARADIYALGVTLFEMLTGRLPFEGSDYEVRVAQINQPPPSPCAAGCPDLPGALEKVVLKAMAKDPADRFATAGKFRRALEEAATRPAPVEPPRPAERGRATEALQALETATSRSPQLVVDLPPSAKPPGPRWRVLLPVSLGLAALVGVALFLGYQKFSNQFAPTMAALTKPVPAPPPKEPAKSPSPSPIRAKTSLESAVEKSQPPREEPKRMAATKSAPREPLKKPEPEAAAAVKEQAKPPPVEGSAEKSLPPQERPKAVASLAISEPKPEPKPEPAPEEKTAKVTPSPDYQQILKKRLAENGLSGLKVIKDGKNRVTISGTVKSQSQKDKVMQVVSAAGLSVPVDYKLVVASDKRPKPAPPQPPRRPQEVLGEALEKRIPLPPKLDSGVLRSGPGEIQRRPLPPRLD